MNPIRLPAFIIPFSLALLTAACATQPAPVPEAKPVVKQEAPTRPFDRQTLFELLVAEFGVHRDEPELALATYVKAARRTQDPLVLERATGIARTLNVQPVALDTALLWCQVAPENPAAHEAAASQLIAAGRLDEAMDHIETLLASHVELNFDFLLNATRGASPDTVRSLTTRIGELLKKYPENHQLWFSQGLLRHEQDANSGMDDIDHALQLQPRYTNALIAKGRLLEEQGKVDEAITFMRENTEAEPDNKRFGLAYARLLLRQKKLADAQHEFERLTKAFPDDTDLTLSLSLVAWENQAEEQAIAQLERLLDTDRASEANSYLGRIALARGKPKEAVEHFALVTPGPLFTAARIQMATLQAQQKQFDALQDGMAMARKMSPRDALQFYLVEAELLGESKLNHAALKVLDDAARAYPNDPNVRYARAMQLGQAGDVTAMERDLREIIARHPDNTDALNALGYTLADRNIHLDEAARLIDKALTIAPDNPAIIDSLGWLRYRQGRNDEALTLLRKAWKNFPDHEVAAHLGEVLWVSKQRDEALDIWQQGLKKTPDSRVIHAAMKRLGATLP